MDVTLHWADLAVMLLVVMAGCAVGYGLLERKLRRAVQESHRELERRLGALTEAILEHEPELAEVISSTDVLGAEEMDGDSAVTLLEIQETPAARGQVEEPVAEDRDEIAPEIQVAMSAAAIAMFGNNARVRAARRIPSRDVVSPWTQQGRVIVQSSHNLRTRRGA